MNENFEHKYKQVVGAHFKDSLTGLFNHGFFQIAVEYEIERCNRYGISFTIAFIDIDSFNQYNQKQGYLQGDKILINIAGLIKKNIRNTDLLARYSGDRFAVILTESDIDSSLHIAKRIKMAIGQLSEGELSASIGLASYPEKALTKEGLLRNVNEALQEAKDGKSDKIYYFKKEKNKIDSHLPKILIVDDDLRNLKLLEALLLPLKYKIFKADNGKQALSILSKNEIDLVLLDIMMPEMDGFEVCRIIKTAKRTRMIPVVLITALDDIASKIKGIKAGADDFLTKPPNKVELLARTNSLIKLKKTTDSFTNIENVLFSLAKAVEAKDTYTQGHIERVAGVAVSLGKRMGLSDNDMEALKYGGVLHDIGKIGVPTKIINKPGPLAPEEFEVMKSHPKVGYNICLPLKKNLGPALDAIRWHHEKLDGSGYPDGLKGDKISLVARIMAVADIYDALITDRPYRKGMDINKALKILVNDANKEKLDKKVVTSLLELVKGSR